MGGRGSKVHPAPSGVDRPAAGSGAPTQPQGADKHCVLAVGNPGCGKSLLLNSLIGQATFKTGFSAGQGLTVKWEICEHRGFHYIDTPGLADAHFRTQAAAAITEALKQQAWYTIVFVATLEDWRIRPQDKVTLELILDAIQNKNLKNSYGIVINKVAQEPSDEHEINKLKSLQKSFFDDAIEETEHVFCFREQHVDDSRGDILLLPGEFKEFFHALPKVFLDKDKNVAKVQTSKWADRMEKLRDQQRHLKAEQDEMLAKLRKLQHEQGIAEVHAQETEIKEMATSVTAAVPDATLPSTHQMKFQEEDETLAKLRKLQGEQGVAAVHTQETGIKEMVTSGDAAEPGMTLPSTHQVKFQENEEVLLLEAGDRGRVTAVSPEALKVKMIASEDVIAVPQHQWHLICKKEDEGWRRQLKVKELANRGIRLEALLDFYDNLLKEEFGFHFKPLEHTTADVVHKVVVPITSTEGKSYSEFVDSGGVQATRMVSHSWRNVFTHLMAAIIADALDKDYFSPIIEQLIYGKLNDIRTQLRNMGKLDTTYWVCAFSINQHLTCCKRIMCPCKKRNLTNETPLCEVDKFDEMMELIFAQGTEDTRENTGHVIAVDAQCSIFKRAWVVAELVVTLTMKTTVTQKYKFLDEEAIDTLRAKTIDVRECDASRKEDIQLVLKKTEDRITSQGKSWEGFHTGLHKVVFGVLDKKVNILCIGDSGVGKQFIINEMKALGRRTTNVTYVYHKLAGFGDPSTRGEAANAIKNALEEGGRHRLFIILTLEAGRVRPDDADMLCKVLEAIPGIGPDYNIIVNKVQPQHSFHLFNPMVRVRIMEALLRDLPRHMQRTKHLWFVTERGKIPPGILEDAAEATNLGPGAVQCISAESEEQKARKARAEVKDLEEQNKRLREVLEAGAKAKEKKQEQQEEDEEKEEKTTKKKEEGEEQEPGKGKGGGEMLVPE